jgi:hypothetical protein
MGARRMAVMAMTATALALAAQTVSTPASLPPNTVLLSDMLRQLSAKPGFTDALFEELQDKRNKSGLALLTPEILNLLHDRIAAQDWNQVDRFPGWPMSEITSTVGVLDRVVADPDSPESMQTTDEFLDVGPYALDAGGSVADFRKPSTLPGFDASNQVSDLGFGVTRGDGAGPLAPEHSDSQRLAYVLNRLAANSLDGVPAANAIWNDVDLAATPEQLIDAIMHTGQTVIVTDSRYFANFGHLHWEGQDVLTPFFVHAQVRVPGTKRPLLVPVSHAEYEWQIRGPLLNADVSFYYGIDGKAQWRAMDSLDQAWVMKRDAHLYRQADVLEITRLSGEIVRTYMRLHQAHPAAPFGGYFTFGVCQDVVAAIEQKMTGRTTLWPNTADRTFFRDPRDAEINTLIRALPNDRDGSPPALDRVFGSLPVDDTDAALARVRIPGLGADLVAVHDAWIAGQAQRIEASRRHRLKLAALYATMLVLAGILAYRVRRRRKKRR